MIMPVDLTQLPEGYTNGFVGYNSRYGAWVCAACCECGAEDDEVVEVEKDGVGVRAPPDSCDTDEEDATEEARRRDGTLVWEVGRPGGYCPLGAWRGT